MAFIVCVHAWCARTHRAREGTPARAATKGTWQTHIDGVRSMPPLWKGQRALIAWPVWTTSTPLSSITSDSLAACRTRSGRDLPLPLDAIMRPRNSGVREAAANARSGGFARHATARMPVTRNIVARSVLTTSQHLRMGWVTASTATRCPHQPSRGTVAA